MYVCMCQSTLHVYIPFMYVSDVCMYVHDCTYTQEGGMEDVERERDANGKRVRQIDRSTDR